MKIAYISADPGVPVFGRKGCSIHVQEIVRAMLKLGHEVHLFATRLGDETRIEAATLHVHDLGPLPKGDAAAREQAALSMNETLRQALAAEAAMGGFDLYYERQSLWSCAALEFACEHEVPAVLEVNAPLIEEQAQHRTLIDRSSAEEIERRAFKAATVITAVSSELAHWLETKSTANGKVHVIPNAVDPDRFRASEPARRKQPAEFVIGFVGTLKAWHGLATLIESFAMLAKKSAQARLLIVGDGPEREALTREIATRQLSNRVEFTGAVAPEAIPGLLGSMDVAVAPYPPLANFYFSPLKLYEYMAAGVAIVASRIGQIEEVIEHDKTGILVPSGDAVALANALRSLQLDPSTRTRLGANARVAIQNNTWDALLKQVFTLAGVNSNAAAMRT
jgi:glycosyltransferase involved in cell wall biosynthesis